jgi:hypothetical protein
VSFAVVGSTSDILDMVEERNKVFANSAIMEVTLMSGFGGEKDMTQKAETVGV